MVQLLNIDSTVLIIKLVGYFYDSGDVGISKLLDGGEDADKVMGDYHLFAVLEDADAAAVQIKVALVAIVGQHNIPKLHRLVQAKLLGQKKSQPAKAVVLWKDLFLFEAVPKLEINHFEIAVEDAHAAHDALLSFIHVFDVHVDEEGHQR